MFVGTGPESLFVTTYTGPKSVTFSKMANFSEFCETFSVISDIYFLRYFVTNSEQISNVSHEYVLVKDGSECFFHLVQLYDALRRL